MHSITQLKALYSTKLHITYYTERIILCTHCNLLIDCILFYVLLENMSLLFKCHHYLRRTGKWFEQGGGGHRVDSNYQNIYVSETNPLNISAVLSEDQPHLVAFYNKQRALKIKSDPGFPYYVSKNCTACS